MFNAQKIYHGCFTKNKDGTNKLIEKGKNCICPTSKPFWKYPEDVSSGAKTRVQEKKNKKRFQGLCSINTLNKRTFRDG